MSIFTSRSAVAGAAVAATLLLAACGGAVGAGDRDELVSGCTSGAAGSGLPEATLKQVCECAADGMIEAKVTMADTTKAQEITTQCVQQAMAGMMGGAAPAPAAPAPAAPAQ